VDQFYNARNSQSLALISDKHHVAKNKKDDISPFNF